MTVARPYRVLVVCTGNTCRSPMAEGLLREMLAGAGVEAEVRSAGTYAVVGGPAQPSAIRVAAEAGIDISGHVARQLDEASVHWADTILCMTRSHAREVSGIDSTAEVRLASEFAPRGASAEGIRDPMGCEEAVYREVFEELRDCLEGFVARRADRLSASGDPGSASPERT